MFFSVYHYGYKYGHYRLLTLRGVMFKLKSYIIDLKPNHILGEV